MIVMGELVHEHTLSAESLRLDVPRVSEAIIQLKDGRTRRVELEVTHRAQEVTRPPDNLTQWYHYAEVTVTLIDGSRGDMLLGTMYRVSQQVSDLGWVDLDLGCSTILPGSR